MLFSVFQRVIMSSHPTSDENAASSSPGDQEEAVEETPAAPEKVCQLCTSSPAKYRCPRCDARTCSLGCVVRHKEETGCSGLRDRTKFVSKGAFSDLDLLSDYRMLEEVNRSVENYAREETAKERRWHLPVGMLQLQRACRRAVRECRLLFMPPSFERRQENTSRFDFQDRTVRWRVRLVFPHCKRTIVMAEVKESTKLYKILEDYVEAGKAKEGKGKEEEEEGGENSPDILAEDPFASYRSAWPGGVLVLLKAEHLSNKEVEQLQDEDGNTVVTRFYELDLKKSLRNNLRGKTVVEHPVVFVVLKSHSDYFPTQVALPKYLERPKMENEARSEGEEEAGGRHNWDWSDYHNTEVAVGSRDVTAVDEEHEEEDDDDDSANPDQTFGLFSREEDDHSDDEDYFEGLGEGMKRRLEEEAARDGKRKRLEEERGRFMRHRGRTWRGVSAAHEDASYVHAFAMQDDADYRDAGKPKEAATSEEVVSEDNYKQYYDYYMKYYQRMYGLPSADAAKSSEEQGPGASSGVAKGDGGKGAARPGDTKPTAALSGLAGYGDSDDDDQ